MLKAVVYAATRHIYDRVVPCVRSAVMNGNIDEVILLIEDDVFPYELPGNVRVINVLGQKWFSSFNPNTQKRWRYMVLMKVCLSKLLPGYERVVFLDCDTLVEHDLTELFEMDLGNCFYAAVPQEDDGREGDFIDGPYYNMGVLVSNLELLRATGKDDDLIMMLNLKEYEFCEQDCINELCARRIRALPGRWNVSDYTIEDSEVYIWHFASLPDWPLFPEARKYMEGGIKNAFN